MKNVQEEIIWKAVVSANVLKDGQPITDEIEALEEEIAKIREDADGLIQLTLESGSHTLYLEESAYQ